MVIMRHRGVVEEGSHAGLASVFDQKGSRADILIRRALRITVSVHNPVSGSPLYREEGQRANLR